MHPRVLVARGGATEDRQADIEVGENRSCATCPSRFATEVADVLQRRGIKGKFTVLPYPAGLGEAFAQGLQGLSAGPTWSAGWQSCGVRSRPRMDITPEILTHTKAIDSGRPLRCFRKTSDSGSTHQTAENAHALHRRSSEDSQERGPSGHGRYVAVGIFGSKVEPEYQRGDYETPKQQVNGAAVRRGYFLHQSGELSLQSKVVSPRGEMAGW